MTKNENQRIYPDEPLGLLYLASYANQNIKESGFNISVKIVDCQFEGPEDCIKTDTGYRSGMSDKEIEAMLRLEKPDVVGITNNYTNHTRDVLDFSALVKRVLPKSILILGGAHATIADKDLIKKFYIDIIVRGEGEVTFWEILSNIYKKKNINKVAGITFRNNRKIKINPDRELIQNLDILPIPDRSLIPYRKYLAKNNYFMTKQSPVGTIFSSRGCPYRCIFCSTNRVWKNKWRGRSAKNVLQEVEYLAKEYGVKEICFMDDQFLGDKKRIIDFCKMVIQKNLKITFIVPSGISPSLFNDEIMDYMKEAGFYRLCFSVDVGTREARDFVRKPIDLEKVRSLVEKANEKGFWTYATFVIGFPFEKKSDIQRTIDYAYNLRVDFLRFYIAQPHLGSDLYDLYLKEGILDRENVEKHHSLYESLFGTKYISAKDLEKIRNSAEFMYIKRYTRNFLNPAYVIREFLPKISSSGELSYFLKILSHYKDTRK